MPTTPSVQGAASPRPVAGELTASWLSRLAAVYRLPARDLLRAITGPLPGRPLAAIPAPGREVYLGPKARQRLALFAGIRQEDLGRRLPAAAHAHPLGTDRGPLWTDWYVPHRPWHTACGPCSRRHTRHPRLARPTPVLVYVTGARHICQRHRRWLLATWDTPSFIDLTHFPEILNAHRRHMRLLRERPDANDALAYACAVVWSWQSAAWPEEHLWPRRTAALARLLGLDNPLEVAAHPLIPYPETIAVAEFLATPAWRHQVPHASPRARTRASTQAAGTVHAELAHRTGRPWLPQRLAEAARACGRRRGLPDPLQHWLDGCIRARAAPSTATNRALLWTLPSMAQAPEHYDDRTGLLHHGPRPSSTRAHALGLTGGWHVPTERSLRLTTPP
ncbi:hypothetical protein [Streptomyces sp. NPDC020983]|uniref:hypothetical protein n=1 Tax=Streptomyces sp. NPDC020983 TaxID=3365106 RepID=UPI0037BA36BF